MMPWLGRGYVDFRDVRAIIAQAKKFRRWRPWMWGPLRQFWALGYTAAGDGKYWGPDTYRWLSRKDRKENCCDRDRPHQIRVPD